MILFCLGAGIFFYFWFSWGRIKYHFIEISSEGYKEVQPEALNNRGEVAGNATCANGARTGFFWSFPLGMIEIRSPAGKVTEVEDINDSGSVFGTLETASGERHLFLWTIAEGLRDLFPIHGQRVLFRSPLNE